MKIDMDESVWRCNWCGHVGSTDIDRKGCGVCGASEPDIVYLGTRPPEVILVVDECEEIP